MENVTKLEDCLSRPSANLISDLAELEGNIMVLGAGGKLGPNIVRMALRATKGIPEKKVLAVSRFSDQTKATRLADEGARIITCDLMEPSAVKDLPDAENIIHLVSARFDMTGRESEMWAINADLPSRIMRRFSDSRIVSLSSGNVYPMLAPASGGAHEDTPAQPVGEYGASCLARERLMTSLSERNNTLLSIIRLNYAVEMRYGPILDIALSVRAGKPISLGMGQFNAVWQAHANEVILRSLLHANDPPFLLNVAGPEIISVKRLAEFFAKKFDQTVTFEGEESETALLSDATKCHTLFGYPSRSLGQVTADTLKWIENDLPVFKHSTGFQKRDGKF